MKKPVTHNEPDLATRIAQLEARVDALDDASSPELPPFRDQTLQEALNLRRHRPADLNEETYTELDRLNDLALVRGFKVLKNSDPKNIGGKYTVWSLKSSNPDEVDDIEHQADTTDEVLAFLVGRPVIRTGGYDQRLTVQAAQERLDDAVLTLTLRALKDHDKN